ncbi:MAG: glycosyltransferase [Bacteroidales bacterium]|jgi:glycosyltransferase involved in cell wall biosynthesis|nr:glycosyltransferase [Bacteroidales bacterium]
MEGRPTVSILTANYNKSEYLREYFDSILKSNFSDFEVVFVDDGSTDDSILIANSYTSKLNLRVISLGRNVGFSNALNIGLERVRGEFVMRLDSDDFMLPSRIDLQVSYLRKHPEVDILGSNTFYYNHNRCSVVGRSYLPEFNADIANDFKHGDIALCHGAIMGRTAFYEKFNYIQNAFPFEEYDLFSRMVLTGGVFYNLNEPLTYYRMYNQNASYKRIRTRENGINLLREKYFNQKLNEIGLTCKVLHRFFYRKAILSGMLVLRIVFLGMAVVCWPKSFFKRFYPN